MEEVRRGLVQYEDRIRDAALNDEALVALLARHRVTEVDVGHRRCNTPVSSRATSW